MSEHQFETFFRRAAAGMTRRASLATLGALGAAVNVRPQATSAKKRKKNKKWKKADRQATEACQQELTTCTARDIQCANQVDPCTTFLTASCGGQPTCVGQSACCSLLGNCDVDGFLACLVAATN